MGMKIKKRNIDIVYNFEKDGKLLGFCDVDELSAKITINIGDEYHKDFNVLANTFFHELAHVAFKISHGRRLMTYRNDEGLDPETVDSFVEELVATEVGDLFSHPDTQKAFERLKEEWEKHHKKEEPKPGTVIPVDTGDRVVYRPRPDITPAGENPLTVYIPNIRDSLIGPGSNPKRLEFDRGRESNDPNRCVCDHIIKHSFSKEAQRLLRDTLWVRWGYQWDKKRHKKIFNELKKLWMKCRSDKHDRVWWLK